MEQKPCQPSQFLCRLNRTFNCRKTTRGILKVRRYDRKKQKITKLKKKLKLLKKKKMEKSKRKKSSINTNKIKSNTTKLGNKKEKRNEEIGKKFQTSYSNGRTDLRVKKFSLHWAREPSKNCSLHLEEQLLFNGIKTVRFKLPTHKAPKKPNRRGFC